MNTHTIFLKFISLEEATQVLSIFEPDLNNQYFSGTKDNIRFDLDIIGTVYEPTGNILLDENDIPYPEYVSVDGYHINLLWWGNLEDLPDLSAYTISPSTPYRVFAE